LPLDEGDERATADFADMRKALEQAGNQRVAIMQFVIGTAVLLGVLFVNTGMLSQIIRDLGYIPQSLQFVGIPLYYILAFLIAVVEAGFGFVHGVMSDPDEGDSKIHFGAILAGLASIGIAVVEGFFYSRMAPDRQQTLTIPFINYSMPQTDVLFL